MAAAELIGVGARCRCPICAGEVERPAGGVAVAGADAAGRTGGHGLVVAPAVAVGGGGFRYSRYMGYIAGQPGSGGVGACRYIRYSTRPCSGCSGGRQLIRYGAVAGLTCGFGGL